MNTEKKSDTNNNMSKINNVIICGLGGLGCICAAAIKDSNIANLKILLDEDRYRKYNNQPTFFNKKEYYFDYILPDETNFNADLVIIATKNDGLDFAITNIKNFVNDNTIIISLLNGINSEKEITKIYSPHNVITSFYIGHSCIRNNRNIFQDGIYEFVIGAENKSKEYALNCLSSFLKESNIKYKISNSIEEEYWKKFMINVGVNQLCAVTGLTLKEIKKDTFLTKRLKDIIQEVKLIAQREGIKNYNKIYKEALYFLLEEIEDATPSMLQDIKAGKKTEVEIFAGEIIKLGQKHNIETPLNKEIYNKIKELEQMNN